MEREAGLNRDAGEVIERLEWEVEQLAKAHEGHEEKLAEAAGGGARGGGGAGGTRGALAELTEDAARLAARHQSAQRLLSDSRSVLDRAEATGGSGAGRRDGGGGAGGGGRGVCGGGGSAGGGAGRG
jgi:chromosome segregation protein